MRLNLHHEARIVAMAKALRDVDLASYSQRQFAYVNAGIEGVSPEDDEEAIRRAEQSRVIRACGVRVVEATAFALMLFGFWWAWAATPSWASTGPTPSHAGDWLYAAAAVWIISIVIILLFFRGVKIANGDEP